ncbi:uncharacterized protein LTR77_008955 [Saxophila tyrrhenica]|uniref:Uncharacterized protein n=1 Tax=Saxophila tyrrhenica TaxID=1690608 RepID=A0AAV9P2I2_9PEZI|nr:hypothetical protein LTR77_008955 [Saxophila tyrrhenica]
MYSIKVDAKTGSSSLACVLLHDIQHEACIGSKTAEYALQNTPLSSFSVHYRPPSHSTATTPSNERANAAAMQPSVSPFPLCISTLSALLEYRESAAQSTTMLQHPATSTSKPTWDTRGRSPVTIPPSTTTASKRIPSPKRRSSPSITLLDVRPTKKQRRLHHNALSIPYNNAQQFWHEESLHHFYVFCPLDRTNLDEARRKNLLGKVVYGMLGNRTVEKLVLDQETGIPWTVPKVVVEFGRVEWGRSAEVRGRKGRDVEPGVLPRGEEMTGEEWEEAVGRGDWRVAGEDRETWERCLEMGVGWLGYRER